MNSTARRGVSGSVPSLLDVPNRTEGLEEGVWCGTAQEGLNGCGAEYHRRHSHTALTATVSAIS